MALLPIGFPEGGIPPPPGELSASALAVKPHLTCTYPCRGPSDLDISKEETVGTPRPVFKCMSTTLNRHDAASGGGRTPWGNSQYLLIASARTRPHRFMNSSLSGKCRSIGRANPPLQSARRDDPLGLPGLLRRFPGRRSRTGGTHPSARRPASPASTYPEVPAVNLTAGGLPTPRFGRTIATWPRGVGPWR
jgi:hypothetical protein